MKKNNSLRKIAAVLAVLSVFSVPGVSDVNDYNGIAGGSSISVSAADNTDYLVKTSRTIIFTNEGGYTAVAKNDGGALSIGRLQWHGTRALNLLKTIVTANTSQARNILGDTLYKEITGKTNWSTRILNDTEKNNISKLIGTSEGKTAQDDLAYNDVKSYVSKAINLGLSNEAAIVYYADLYNQRPVSANSIAKNAASDAGSYSKVTLDLIHKYALKDASIGKYKTRRNRTYEYCKKLEPVPVKLGISNPVLPSGSLKEGKPFDLKGIVTSPVDIVHISVGVVNMDGSVTKEYIDKDIKASKSFDMQSIT